MNIPVVVVSGGPCGGKSTFLVRVRELLERYNIYPLIISETATELITAGATPKALGLQRFQEQLFLYTLSRESHYLEIAQQMNERQVVILCDRGVFDCAAYMGKDEYTEMIEHFGYSPSELMSRYDLVIHLVTAASGAEDFYTLSNNAARTETPEEARSLDTRTQLAWLGHPHHMIVDNSTDFPAKIMRGLRSLSRILNMPEPTEIERKFRILNFVPTFIPEDAVTIAISQDYLTAIGSKERRLRKRMHDGETRFFYTEKSATDEPSTRIEREREITETEYLSLMEERDESLHTIQKTRYVFPFSGKLFELDIFEGRHEGLILLEVELQHIHDPITFPPNWEMTEVTEDQAYKNRALAE